MKSLALLSAHGYDPTPALLFDDQRIEPGNHLRWLLRSDLGLPQRFILYRSSNENILNEVSRILRRNRGQDFVNNILPLICDKVRSSSKQFAELDYGKWDPMGWLAQGSPNEASLRSQFGSSEQLMQLRNTIAQLFEVPANWTGFNPQQIRNMHQKMLHSQGAERKTQMSTLAALQLAALDPYIARMIGFYYIDRQPNLPALGYIVEADYGNRLWPLSYREPRRPNGYTLFPPQEDLDGVKVLAPIGRLVYEWSDNLRSHLLTIRGLPVSLLRLQFEDQAQEVILWYESDRAEENAGSVGFLPEVNSTFVREGSLWKLTIRSSTPTIGFDIAPRSQATWKIHRIEWRRQSGVMGIIASNCTIINRAEPNRVVQPPILTVAEASPSPLVLRHPGVITPGLSNLQLSFLKPKAQVLALDPGNPVRMLYGRLNGAAIAPLNKTELAIVPQAEPELPTLRLWMPFDGTYTNLISGRSADANRTRFVKDGPENGDRFSLLLHGGTALSLPLEIGLKMPGAAFSVFAWVKVDNNLTENVHIPVFNNGLTNGFSLGVWRTGNACKVHLVLNSSTFESAQTFPLKQWVPIGFNYNGDKIRLFTFGMFREFDTDLGSLRFNSGGVGIGGNFDSSYSGASPFFRGQIADVSVWSEAINWLEAKGRIRRKKNRLSQRLAETLLWYSLPTRNYNTASEVMRITLPALALLQKELSIHAWVNIQPGRSYPTMVGNDWSSSFWLGLESPSNQLKCWLNGASYLSTNAVPLNRWVHIALTIQEGSLNFYIDGALDKSHTIPPALIRPNPTGQPLRVGGDTNDSYLLLGSMSDLRIYPLAVAPNKTETEYGIFNYVDQGLADGTYTYRAANIDLFGRISDWGSASTKFASSAYQINAPLSLRGKLSRIRAAVSSVRFVPPRETPPQQKGYWEVITADVLGLTEQLLGNLQHNEVIVEQQKQVPVMGKGTLLENRTIRQNFEIKEVSRQRTDSKVSIRWELWDVPFAQLQIQPGNFFELQYDAEVQLEWQWSGLQQVFNPGVDTFQVFAHSGSINQWQGRVTAIAPGVSDRHWAVTTNLTILGNPNELTGQICTIDKQAFIVGSHSNGANAVFRLRYDGYPVIAPGLQGTFAVNIPEINAAWSDVSEATFWETRPARGYPLSISSGNLNPATSTIATASYTKVTDDELTSLRRDKNVDWLEPSETLRRIQFSNFPRPADTPVLAVSDYVPSALVVNLPDPVAGANGVWEVWYVHWHEWGSDNTLTCWVSLKDEKKGRIVQPKIRISSDYPVKFYSGCKFYATGEIQPPTDGQTATLPWHFAVSARAMSVPHRYTVSRLTSLVAVDRRKPPAPPRPKIVSIAKADVQGQSEAVVEWEDSEASLTGFNLYRATDTAIYSRDLDQRRLRQGYYAENHPLADDGFDLPDADAHEFLRAVRHKDAAKIAPEFSEVFGKPLSELTFDDLFLVDKNSRHWQALNLIWQYWADRVYPALSDQELRNIAERKGNETAFTLVNNQPIPNVAATNGQMRFLDKVNGVVSNRYFYRLRTISINLMMSTEWGTVSNGMGAEVPASKPQTPVWTKVEPGDRKVRLEWDLNREEGVMGYILFRAEEALLPDLRWARLEKPPGLLIREIEDPRLKVSQDGYERILEFSNEMLPSSFSIQNIGVYRVDEFDPTKIPLEDQSQAFNYAHLETQIHPSNAHFRRISNLRSIALEQVMILLVTDENGNTRIINKSVSSYPFTDDGLRGKHTYSYRLAAINGRGALSQYSVLQTAKTLEVEPPPPPIVLRQNRHILDEYFDQLELEIQCGNYLQIMVQMRRKGRLAWETILTWVSPPAQPYLWLWEIEKKWDVELKIWTRTEHGLPCATPVEITCLKIR